MSGGAKCSGLDIFLLIFDRFQEFKALKWNDTHEGLLLLWFPQLTTQRYENRMWVKHEDFHPFAIPAHSIFIWTFDKKKTLGYHIFFEITKKDQVFVFCNIVEIECSGYFVPMAMDFVSIRIEFVTRKSVKLHHRAICQNFMCFFEE